MLGRKPRLAAICLAVPLALAFAALPLTVQAERPPLPGRFVAPKPTVRPTPTPARNRPSASPRPGTYYVPPASSQLSLNPFSGQPGARVTVTGKWLYYHQKLSLYWDTKDRIVGTVVTDASGSFTTTIQPPQDYVGNHSICLLEAPWVQCQIFGLLPQAPATLSLDPLEGQPGTSVQITGNNFDAGGQVTLVWQATSKTLGTLVANSQGQLSGRFEIPEGAAGDYQLCLNPVKSPTRQPVCTKVTVDPVPVATVNEASTGLAKLFSYLIIGLGLVGGLMFFLASRRHASDIPNATVEHHIGPSLMPSTHREFWESLELSHSLPEDKPKKGVRQLGG